jgi:site-specific DNA recombinase
MGETAPSTARTAPVTSGLTAPIPVAFLGRTSTLALQDPVASLNRQLRIVQSKLLPGMFLSAYYWDVESGGLDLDQRSQGTAHHQPQVGIPRDGGMADLLAEAASPEPRFAAVMCEDIERSGRDTFNALLLERRLSDAGIPLLATDEPISIDGMNASTLLLRRMKQGVAEWLRFQIKEKAWNGLVEHTMAGWNIGPAPYGYTLERVPHPVPVKAAEGKVKSRLITEPVTAAAVQQIYTWRTRDQLGIPTITRRLRDDPDAYPPPEKGVWLESTVAQILANPKYTGHMVYGRRRTTGGKTRYVPRDEWIWSPAETHPVIIDRPVWEAAQDAGAAHGSSRDPGSDGEDTSSHPQTRRTYVLRGRIRCRICQRRMSGTTRNPNRATSQTYYRCPHQPGNTRHTAAAPGHPTTVAVNETHLLAAVNRFFAERIFGPDRAILLATQIPATAARDHAQRQAKAESLRQRLRQINAAEDGHTQELEELRASQAPARAITALRTRILERFAALEDERATIDTQLAALDTAAVTDQDPGLLDLLPYATVHLQDAPARLHTLLYQAFSLEMLYRPAQHQVTIWATLTTSTPAALAAIIEDSDNPVPPAHLHVCHPAQRPRDRSAAQYEPSRGVIPGPAR